MIARRIRPLHVVGVLASAMLLLGGCGDGGGGEDPVPGPSGPASLDELVEGFRAAFDDRDVEAARALFCQAEQENFDGRGMTELIEEHVGPGSPDEGGGQAVTGLEIEVTAQTDSYAQVQINYELETAGLGRSETATVQPNGTWLFCSLET